MADITAEDIAFTPVSTEDIQFHAAPEQPASPRETSVADQVPGLNQLNLLYEKMRGMAVPAAAKVLSKGLALSSGHLNSADTAAPIEAAVDFSIPRTIPEAGAQAAGGYVLGKVPAALSYLTRAFRSTRPLQREIATEALGRLLPAEAEQAQAWFKAADKAGETLPTQMGRVGTHEFPVQVTPKGTAIPVKPGVANKVPLEDMQATLKELQDSGATRADVNAYKQTIESSYPGYKAHEQGYAKLMDNSRIQKMVGATDPLKALENDIATGQVIGGGGEIVKKGGKATHFLSEGDLTEVKKIMTELGPNPGEHYWHKMLAGHAIGGVAGALVGYNKGGLSGGTIGAAAGIAGPQAINFALTQMLKHPTTRAFLKRALTNESALSNPHFWQTAGALGTRLGIDLFGGEDNQQ